MIPDSSLPKAPSRCDALNLLLTSIALEEMALAGLIHQISGELCRTIQDPRATTEDLIEANAQAQSTLKLIIKKEMLLLLKMEEVLETPIVVGFDDCEK